MAAIVESVPNFSEGRDQATLDAIAGAIERHDKVTILDRTADADHQRSVYTLSGALDPMLAALDDAVAAAVEHIDLRRHRGVHPRIGAADVVPLVPLGTVSLAECVEAAKDLGARMAERLGLPVYLYAEAASRPQRRILADIRRPGFEGLAAWMAQPGNEPDFGPPRPHPTAGASVVGARRMLIAFNIQLSTSDASIARRIAADLRERGGGLPAVQALGVDLASQDRAQVSTNLLDHVRTPLWKLWEEVERLARQAGVGILDSELIGLAPAAALIDVADHIGTDASLPLEARLSEAADWLRIRHFHPSMALELRLRRQPTAR